MPRHFESAPCLCEQPDRETADYTMLRIKDPQRSLDVSTRVLGRRLLSREKSQRQN